MKLKGKRKKIGVGRFFNSFYYSIEGLKHAYKNEQSLLIHLTLTMLVVLFGFIFKIALWEWIICILSLGIVLGLELLNTAIEAVVDMVMPDIHPLAKIAKDTASSSVFIMTVLSFLVCVMIFFPRFYGVLISLF